MNDDNRPSGRHQVSIGHLVMGIAFLFIVGIWALVQSDTVTGDDVRWLLPIPWVVAGVVGLVATAITGPRRYAVRQTGWVGPPGDQLDQQNDQLDQQNDPNDPNDFEETP
ncbi:MAG TPA: hypothetical protein VFI19_04705 [Nocardioides sp.]|nr:hypothetical protein [Nocardioides sp.]